MSKDHNKTENTKISIADFDAYRTGEEYDIASGDLLNEEILDDLNEISGLFQSARPDSAVIKDSVNNAVFDHIKEKSRSIRREQKIVRLFPRWQKIAVAVMAVFVCSVSLKIFFRTDPDNNGSMINVAPVYSKLPEDIDGNGKINIVDAYILDRRLKSNTAISQKFDLNKDREVNNADIKSITDTAVSLGRRKV